MSPKLQIDIEFCQCNHHGESLCGDSIVCHEVEQGERSVVVLSDGLGHGERANILSSLAAEMMTEVIVLGGDIRSGSERILSQLPDDKAHSIVYATFSSVDINLSDGVVCIAEHGNPQAIIIRDRREFQPIWCNETILLRGAPPQSIRATQFRAEPGDLVVVVSDGVTQSGIGSKAYPFGWGRENVVMELVGAYGQPLRDTVDGIVRRAVRNDNDMATDDISCVGIRFK